MTFVPFYSKPFNADKICYCFNQLMNMINVGGISIQKELNGITIDTDATSQLFSNTPSKFKLVESSQGKYDSDIRDLMFRVFDDFSYAHNFFVVTVTLFIR